MRGLPVLDHFQRNAESVQERNIEGPECVETCQRDTERPEEWLQLSLAKHIHVPWCSIVRIEQELVAFGSLPCDLFPEQGNQLRRQCKRPQRVVGFLTLLFAMPDRLIDGEAFPVYVGQFSGQLVLQSALPGEHGTSQLSVQVRRWNPRKVVMGICECQCV